MPRNFHRRIAALGGDIPFADYFTSISDMATWILQETSGDVAGATNDALALGRGSVINGEFATDISGWVAWLTPTTLEWSAGRLHFVGDISDGANQANPRETSKTYAISFDYEVISGSMRIVATGLVTSGSLTGTGTFSNSYTATTSGDENTIFQALANGTEFYIDNVSVKQTNILASSMYADPANNPFSGAVTGASIVSGAGKIQYARSFDGTNDFIDIYSAELNSSTDPTDFSIGVFAQKDTWDATERDLLSFTVDANNYIRVTDTTTAGTLQWDIMAGGVLESITHVTDSPSGWFYVDVTVTGGNLIATYNGSQVGSTAVAGTFVGNFATMILGARNDTPTNVHLGKLAYAGSGMLRSLTATEKLDIYNRSGI